jgi:NAD(P)-dependent dehydrogenase (short-subunit alcohol dehydrogenase family)
MDGLLAGDAELVTGAAEGIGFAVAAHWRARVLADNNAEAGEAACASTLLATSTAECFSSPIP